MKTYPKIHSPFFRHMEGPRKGKLMKGKWARPEFEYLKDNEWEFTEKVDGCNIRIWLDYDNGNGHVLFHGRSDNATIPAPLLRHLESTFGSGLAPDPRWFNAFEGSGEVTLFGEGYGPKIQNGGNYRDDVSFILFDVLVTSQDGAQCWLRREDVNDVAAKLGLDAVPVIGRGTIQDAIDIVSDGITFNKQGAVIRWGRGGLKSRFGDFEAEGIVARPTTELFDRMGNRIVLKIKGKDFK